MKLNFPKTATKARDPYKKSYFRKNTVAILSVSLLIGGIQSSKAKLKEGPENQKSIIKLTSEKNRKIKSYYLITAKRKALLNTIRYAEGTWKGGNSIGYRIIYGGDTFNNFKKHPNKLVKRKYASAAAGAYQFIPSTWKFLSNDMSLANFSPVNQDQAAIHLIRLKGVLQELDAKGLTQNIINRLSEEWASLPNISEQSTYGQPVKNKDELFKFYQLNLKHLLTNPLSENQTLSI